MLLNNNNNNIALIKRNDFALCLIFLISTVSIFYFSQHFSEHREHKKIFVNYLLL